MPHTKSAKKNLRKSEKRRVRNRATLRTVKTYIKRFQAAVAEGTPEKIKDAYNEAAKKVDKAAAKRVVHPNLAARKKAQMARAMNEKLAPKAPPAQ
jgi:small subunit ribosomal protein S20